MKVKKKWTECFITCWWKDIYECEFRCHFALESAYFNFDCRITDSIRSDECSINILNTASMNSYVVGKANLNPLHLVDKLYICEISDVLYQLKRVIILYIRMT